MFRLHFLILLFIFSGCNILNQNETYNKDLLTINKKTVNEIRSWEANIGIDEYKIKKEINSSPLELTNELEEIYKEYCLKKDDQLLIGLEPFDILKLNFKAEKNSHFEIKYYLINKNSYMPSVEDYLSEVKDNRISRDNTEKILNRLKESSYKTEEIIQDNIAYIIFTFNDNVEPLSMHYRLEKTDKGIWKMGWLSSQ